MHPLLRAVADRQSGVFTTADARRAGYRPDEIRHLLASRAWTRLRRGVYATAEDVARAGRDGTTHRQACIAVLVSLGRRSTVVSHGSAARLWGLLVPTTLDRTVRLTDPDQWREGRGYRVACASLVESQIVVQPALSVTSVPRTLIDCAREWELTDAVIALDDALQRERVERAQLLEAVLGATHWTGAARAARAVHLADGGAESPLETRGRLRIVGSGLPVPELQVEVHDERGLIGIVDGWYDDAAVALEFDGRTKFTDPWRGRTPAQVHWEEKRREDRMRAVGLRFVRIVDADLDAQWQVVERRIRQALATPGPAVRRFTVVRRPRRLRRTG